MTQLIAFRALQGLGAGGLIVVTLAVDRRHHPARASGGKYQGFFGAVFGVSTVIGPLLGGFFVDNLSWRWIFYVNVPIGVIALAVIAVAFRTPTATDPALDRLPRRDLARRALSRDRALHEPRRQRPGRGARRKIIGLMVLSVILVPAFVWAEHRGEEPIMPLSLFRNHTFAVTSAVGFVVGFALFGAITYLPLYFQITKGSSPTAPASS